MKKSLMVAGVLVVLVVLIFFTQSSGASFETIDAFEGEIEIYKSASCGCCGIYSEYMKGKVDPKVNVINLMDTYEIKETYGVPQELQSCHTTVVGNYFVEGHIPLEAVEKLLKENPDIKGIAMPGMPSGSPGMPGGKYSDFVIYAVHHDGSHSEFMRI
ncbi:MAG TPA: hypothetical protein ENH99_02110 [Candidatus Pacearchaeota archaeon]|nr:hypothetical protein [Candidatus Pacearchaeota archaeon]